MNYIQIDKSYVPLYLDFINLMHIVSLVKAHIKQIIIGHYVDMQRQRSVYRYQNLCVLTQKDFTRI